MNPVILLDSCINLYQLYQLVLNSWQIGHNTFECWDVWFLYRYMVEFHIKFLNSYMKKNMLIHGYVLTLSELSPNSFGARTLRFPSYFGSKTWFCSLIYLVRLEVRKIQCFSLKFLSFCEQAGPVLYYAFSRFPEYEL